MTTVLTLLETALELGLVSALTVLALFLSYSMLNVCDLSTDGCFTLGATVGAAVAIAGHPYLSIAAAMLEGVAPRRNHSEYGTLFRKHRGNGRLIHTQHE